MTTFSAKVLFALAAGLAAGYIGESFAVGVAVFAASLAIAWVPIYMRYAQDNPQNLWFKRKLFGWGWTPVTWQGWMVVLIYAAVIAGFSLTIDENSPPSEVAFMLVLPVAILTGLLIRIAYRKGEKPKWQWGKDISKYE